MNKPAIADALHPITWPEGFKAAASFTFDVDAESCTIAHDPAGTRRMSLMSHQSYGPKIAVPRLLAILARQDHAGSRRARVHRDIVQRLLSDAEESDRC